MLSTGADTDSRRVGCKLMYSQYAVTNTGVKLLAFFASLCCDPENTSDLPGSPSCKGGCHMLYVNYFSLSLLSCFHHGKHPVRQPLSTTSVPFSPVVVDANSSTSSIPSSSSPQANYKCIFKDYYCFHALMECVACQ